MRKQSFNLVLAGAITGCINGLFGAGGGMVLIPMLTLFCHLEETEVFSTSITMILPMCVISLLLSARGQPFPWSTALPYLLGSLLGGIVAGLYGKKIPTIWLHRILGVLILYGGIRYLC